MADSLLERGPDAILDVVFNMEFDPTNALAHREEDREALSSVINEACAKVGGRKAMQLKIAEASRRAYARAIALELELRWHAVAPPDAGALDLAHQLGRLWAATSDLGMAETLFRRVLAELKSAGKDSTRLPGLARLDRTTAELATVLHSAGRVDDAHAAECDVSTTNELAVSASRLPLINNVISCETFSQFDSLRLT